MVERPAHAPKLQTLLGAAGGTLLSLLLVSSPVAAAQEVFEGPARIVDGDTLYIGKDKVRLYGVDAPEKAQTCRNSKGQPYDW
jgi:endonuclease YncB( thermonuclease family)